MKAIAIAVTCLVGATLGYFGVLYGASELGGEVVVLHRPTGEGGFDRVRVWIVDQGHVAWIEHGDAGAPWITRLARDPLITVERGGAAMHYRAAPDPAAHALYHRLRRAKYGLADRIVALATGGGECRGLPVRLVRGPD